MELQSARKWSLRQLSTNSITNLRCLAQTEVGRAKSSGLCLGWAYLSSRHAAFVVNCYGNLLLRDLCSNGGTFVNKQRLPTCENKVLAHGDIVSFGVANFEHSMSKEMKKCFFEVIADDKPSIMGTSTMAGTSTATVANNGKPIMQSSKPKDNKGKAKSPIKNMDPSKEMAKASTVAKGKMKVQPIVPSGEAKQNPTNPIKNNDVFKNPAEDLTSLKGNNTVPARPTSTLVQGNAVNNIIQQSKPNVAMPIERKEESVNHQTTDLIKQKAEGENKIQPVKPDKKEINPIKSPDSSKVLAQGSTGRKNTVKPLKTFIDDLMAIKTLESILKDDSVSKTTNKDSAQPSTSTARALYIDDKLVMMSIGGKPPHSLDNRNTPPNPGSVLKENPGQTNSNRPELDMDQGEQKRVNAIQKKKMETVGLENDAQK